MEKAHAMNRVVVWGIYHRDREYARTLGDPLLAALEARSKEEAEDRALHHVSAPSGLWAHPLPEREIRELRGEVIRLGGMAPRVDDDLTR
jgi:hypothetical protein